MMRTQKFLGGDQDQEIANAVTTALRSVMKGWKIYDVQSAVISEEVVQDAAKLRQSLQRLGKALAGCEMCPVINCQLQEQINEQVEQAIRSVAGEWKIYA